MAFKLHHIVLRVDHLDTAIKDFTNLGFTVIPGGTHMGKISYNALIFFSDQTYIELLAIKPGFPASVFKFLYQSRLLQYVIKLGNFGIVSRFYGRAFKYANGIIDYALYADDHDQKGILKRGLKLHSPFSAGRKTPDGQKIQWEMINTRVKEFPFLISNIKPSMYVSEEACQHKNGTTGIANLFIITESFNQISNQYHLFLGFAPNYNENHDHVSFSLGSSSITLVSEQSNVLDMEKVARHGAGRFALHLSGLSPNGKQQTNLLAKYGLVLRQ